ARPACLEHATGCLEGSCSGQLSYGRNHFNRKVSMTAASWHGSTTALHPGCMQQVRGAIPRKWETTSVRGLYRRQPSGVFYAQAKVAGKTAWHRLNTKGAAGSSPRSAH